MFSGNGKETMHEMIDVKGDLTILRKEMDVLKDQTGMIGRDTQDRLVQIN
jgi:hypothetical protein